MTGIPDADDADALRAAIERAITAATEALAARGASTASVAVKIRVEPAKAGFRATLEGTAAGGARKDVEIACIPCSESELVESIRSRYESLAADLSTQSSDGSTTSASTETDSGGADGPGINGGSPATDDGVDGDDAADGKAPGRAPRLGPVGIAGVVALGVGVASLGAGVGLAVKPDEIDDPTPGLAPELRSTHDPGYALLGVGSAVVVTGIALLVVDRVKARRTGASPDTQAQQSSPRRVRAAPWASPASAGLVLSGRF